MGVLRQERVGALSEEAIQDISLLSLLLANYYSHHLQCDITVRH